MSLPTTGTPSATEQIRDTATHTVAIPVTAATKSLVTLWARDRTWDPTFTRSFGTKAFTGGLGQNGGTNRARMDWVIDATGRTNDNLSWQQNAHEWSDVLKALALDCDGAVEAVASGSVFVNTWGIGTVTLDPAGKDCIGIIFGETRGDGAKINSVAPNVNGITPTLLASWSGGGQTGHSPVAGRVWSVPVMAASGSSGLKVEFLYANNDNIIIAALFAGPQGSGRKRPRVIVVS